VLFLAANARVKLDDEGWQRELVAQGLELRPRAFIFDPLARMKASSRDENPQKDMAPILEFIRQLRDDTAAGVWFVHHTGHQGDHMRGTSDMESVWETKLTWKRDGHSPEVTILSEHREAGESDAIRYRIQWDHDTRTMRFPLIEDDVEARIRAHLADHPTDSANAVYDAVKGNRPQVLAIVKRIRESGTEPEYQLGTSSSGATERSGTTEGSLRASGTTTASPDSNRYQDGGTTPGEDVS
jgi:hypothetical protein